MSSFNVQQFGQCTIVEFTDASLMDRLNLDKLGKDLIRLVDEEDRRKMILDFTIVEYISSQTIGILLAMRKKIASLKGGQLVLCGVSERLLELLKITRLDAVFAIKPTTKEAAHHIERHS